MQTCLHSKLIGENFGGQSRCDVGKKNVTADSTRCTISRKKCRERGSQSISLPSQKSRLYSRSTAALKEIACVILVQLIVVWHVSKIYKLQSHRRRNRLVSFVPCIWKWNHAEHMRCFEQKEQIRSAALLASGSCGYGHFSFVLGDSHSIHRIVTAIML